MIDASTRRGLLQALVVLVSLGPARSADVFLVPLGPDYAVSTSPGDSPPSKLEASSGLVDPQRYEVRFGGFAHGVESAEKGTVDLNPEFIFPRLPFGQAERWSIFLPRAHVGGLINLEGRTSSFYAGALWTVPLSQRVFAEIFLDGAAHDGYAKSAPPGHNDLGCPYLFHVGGSSGFHFDRHWSLMITFDHQSNGHGIFGTECDGMAANTCNQGINDLGARIGYSF